MRSEALTINGGTRAKSFFCRSVAAVAYLLTQELGDKKRGRGRSLRSSRRGINELARHEVIRKRTLF